MPSGVFRAGVGTAVRDSFSQGRTSWAELWFGYTFLLPAFTKESDNGPRLARECMSKRRRNGNLEQLVDSVGMGRSALSCTRKRALCRVCVAFTFYFVMFTTSLARHGQHLIIRELDTDTMQRWTEKLKMLSLPSARAW
jgi:hypothetical protein